MKKSDVWISVAGAVMLAVAFSLLMKQRTGGRGNAGTARPDIADRPVKFPGKAGVHSSEVRTITVLRRILQDKDVPAVGSIVRMLSGSEMEEALALLLKMKPGWQMVREFLSEWADIDPAVCAGWVTENMPKGSDRSFILRYVLDRWAGKDVQKAYEWAQSLPPEQGRDTALQAVFDHWASLDPEAAAKAIARLKDFNSCNLAKGVIAWHWARKNIDAATAWAWNLPKDSGYVYALYNIALVLRDSPDRGRASEWARSFPAGPADNPVLKRIASFLAGSDSAGTVSLLSENMPGGLGNMPDIQLFLVRWAKKNPEDAAMWARQLADSRARESVLNTISQVVESGNRASAVNAGETAGSGQAAPGGSTDNSKTEELSASEILSQDLPVAVSLAEQIPDGPERDAVMHSIALRWAEDDPAGAAAWALQQMPDGRELNVTLRTIVWGWAEKDGASALAWVNQLSDGGKKLESQATVAMALARSNPAAAAGVVDQMPYGQTRNDVVSNVAFQWAHTDRNAANTWAQGLTVEQGRDQALASIQRALSN